jgi:hypothetical protein
VSTKISILHDRYSNEYQVFSGASFKKWAKFGLEEERALPRVCVQPPDPILSSIRPAFEPISRAVDHLAHPSRVFLLISMLRADGRERSAGADRPWRSDARNGEAAARAERIGYVMGVLHRCSVGEGMTSLILMQQMGFPKGPEVGYLRTRRQRRKGQGSVE